MAAAGLIVIPIAGVGFGLVFHQSSKISRSIVQEKGLGTGAPNHSPRVWAETIGCGALLWKLQHFTYVKRLPANDAMKVASFKDFIHAAGPRAGGHAAALTLTVVSCGALKALFELRQEQRDRDNAANA